MSEKTLAEWWQVGRDREGPERYDAHRAAAHGQFDQLLEEGRITPEEAQKRKDQWDREHGYQSPSI